MNAPDHTTASVLDHVPLHRLAVSSSPVQALRRQRFNEFSIGSLAESMGNGVGIVEPLIVRPIESAQADYEIIAGERRYLAAKMRGLATAPCIVRYIDDTQALEIQMIENLQRNDFHPLEEAAGFRELLRLKSTPGHSYTPKELGDELGKSRSYVYARLKLLDLCPEGQKALQEGDIDASKALLLARFRSHKLQAKALEVLLTRGYYSYRKLVDEIRGKFMQDLNKAPFDLTDADLFSHRSPTKAERNAEVLGIACTECPHNSANDPELQADFEEDARVCTHTPCYEVKVVAFHARRVGEARAAGRTILSGDEAKALIPRGGWNHRFTDCDARHLNLDAVCEFPEEEPEFDGDTPEEEAAYDKLCDAWSKRRDAWGDRTYRQILGDDAPTGVVLDLGKDGVHEIVPVKEAAKLLKAKGIELDVPGEERQAAAQAKPSDPAAEQRAREKEELARRIDLEYRARLYKAIIGKWKPPFKRFDLQQIHELAVDQSSVSEELVSEAFGGKVPDEHKANEADLMRLIFALLFPAHEIESTHSKPGRLLDYAGRLKIDAKKIRAAVTAELTPKAEKPATAKGKKK